MRNKLIELIQESVGGCSTYWAELIADHLIENGAVMAPCRIGETIYMIVTVRRRPNLPKVSFVKTTYLTESNFFEVIRRYGKTVFLTNEEAVAHLPEPPKEEV